MLHAGAVLAQRDALDAPSWDWQAGDVIAQLDTESLKLQVQAAEAAVTQAETAARETAETLARQEQLLESGTVTRVSVDAARTQAEAAAASLVQAQKSLETALEGLASADLIAPFTGIVNSVEAKSFSTIRSLRGRLFGQF